MKKWAAFLFLCFLVNSFSQTNISPHFSELRGMEDQQGNTHLFYRIYEEQIDHEGNGFKNNNIYHSDLNLGIDTLFLEDFWQFNSGIVSFSHINDFEFWNNNTSQFIYCGGEGFSMDNLSFIVRYDDGNTYFKTGSAKKIEISKQNDSLICVGVNVFESPGLIYTITSNDGGWNWVNISDLYQFTSLSPFNDQSYFAQEIQSGNLYKTMNSGANFYLVDNYSSIFEIEYLYDLDAYHIYRTTADPIFENYLLIISNNQGEPFSWQTKYSSNSEIFISLDESISGTVYLADKKNILISTDFGNNFSTYKTLERKIVGIYKKPNSNKLYAASKYKIYEITPDTIQIIKSLPIPEEILNFYPLVDGNKWIYDEVTYVQDPYPNVYFRILVKEVIGDTTAPNGKQYFKVNDETIWESSVLERVDSTEGKVYRYYEDPSLPENEYLAYDLLSEVGDTISSYRLGFNTVFFTTMYAESTFEKWGLTKRKKVFEEYTLHPPIFSLTEDIGLDSIYFYFDFGDTWITLRGCIIDGVIYGDTTTVDVEDGKTLIANEFRLYQNYPNPFNPSTKIKYSVPQISEVTLKIYDVLGNEIATLVNEEKPAGEYEVEFNASDLPSGIYFYQLKAGRLSQTNKMILLK